MPEILKSILLGIIQGISEPIPVSSSAQVLFYQNFIKFNQGGLLEFNEYMSLINLGSSLAILLILMPRIKSIIGGTKNYIQNKNASDCKNYKMFTSIILMTIPIAVFGFILKKPIDELINGTSIWQKYYVPAIGLLLTATLIRVINVSHANGSITKFTWLNSIISGISQVFAIVPGISRSGTTFFTTRIQGLNIKSALELIFIAYLPVSFGLMFLDIVKEPAKFFATLIDINIIAGILAAFIATYLSFSILMKLYIKQKLNFIAYYCIAISFGYFILGMLAK
jgi:undecaprenyl-diphosphatase